MRKILSSYLYYRMPLFFCASSLEEDTWKTVKREDGLPWEDGKGCNAEMRCLLAFSFLSSGTGYQFTSDSDWTQKAEVDEQGSQSACVGTQASACTHSRTEFSPFAFTSSPWRPLLFEKKKIFKSWVSIHQTDKSFSQWCSRACLCHLHGQAKQCWSAGTWGDPAERPYTALDPLLCKSLWKIGYNESLWTCLSCSPLWDLLGLRQKGESVGSWHHFQINFFMKWLGNMAAMALLLKTLGFFFFLLLPGFQI